MVSRCIGTPLSPECNPVSALSMYQRVSDVRQLLFRKSQDSVINGAIINENSTIKIINEICIYGHSNG